MSYLRFAAMIAVSTVVMFVLMYFNTYALDHVFFSQTRSWMALVMGATMALIMIGFMWSMYGNTKANAAIVVASLVVFAVSLWLKAMIPHHSIAVLTSERAHIHDPRVRQLADTILQTQLREIDEMKGLIAVLTENPVAADAPELPASR